MGSKSSKQQQQQQQRSTISGNNSTSVLGNKNTRRRDLENEEEESSDDSDEADDICDKNNNNNNNRNNNNNKLLSSSSSSTSLSPSSSFLSLENAVNVAGSRLTKLPNIVIGNIFHVIDNNRDKLALFNTCKKMRSLRNFLYFSNIDIAPPPYGRDYDYAFLDCAEMITLPLSIYNHFISTLYHLPAFINNNNIGNEDEKRQIKLKSLTIYDFEATGIDLSTLPNFINCITLVGPFNSSVGMENNNNQLNNSINSLLSSNGITRQREFIIPDHVTSLTHYYTGMKQH
ncbi:hypothetical protein DFA_02555 [Cavenderia fasciculata]|uniref:F-box domain-containing protein n=1 Tax=Cavenderia fasciculata TaxID=261658 RepID=F4PZQ2_CACFS|nr:uncharacterized protein DFA_02555 [Cavenderia fasciculata]EGG18816.1 hypothetical protein DFA_02555 [Cavenderia fasciculata]|eukprot:XP_004357278.1 hypothetical protein DFA_02555 [Cavenderia fasciculata]